MADNERNFIRVTGRVSKDPMIKDRVAFLNIAVNSYRRKRDVAPDAKYPNETNWFKIVCFKAIKDQCHDIRKGDFVTVEGSCEINTWGEAPNQRTDVEIHASWLGSESREQAPQRPQHREETRAPSRGGGPPAGHPAAGPGFFDDGDEPPQFGGDGMDDGVPFGPMWWPV